MDDLEYSERAPASIADALLNLLTVGALLATATVAAVVGLVFLDPQIPINPFPPPTLPAVAQFPSPTNTSEFPTLPPTWTLTPTQRPTETLIPSATSAVSATPSATFTPVLPGASPQTPTATATGPTPTPSRTLSVPTFTLQNGSPVALSNFANTAGCNWMGIAGQAFDLNGKPIAPPSTLLVHLEGGGLVLDSLLGSAQAYGPGGYEFFLNNRPVATEGVYRVQLLDINGQPLSDVVLVDTFADCSKNLILVNFVQNH